MVAVIFDLDGVIVDNKEAHKRAFEVFLERKNRKLEDGQYERDIQGMHNDEIFPYLFPGHDDRHAGFAKEKESIYRDLFAKDIGPVAGLLDFLDELEQNDVPKALATNAPEENITFVLTRTGTLPYFKEIVHRNDVEKGKPDPEMFLIAAERLSVSPDCCVVFEDSLPGIEAAHSAGMKVVGVATSHTKDELHEADLAIDDFTGFSLDDVKELLEK